MEFLSARSYVLLLADELGSVDVPFGPARRIGVADHMPSGLEIIRRDLGSVVASVRAGASPEKKLDFATELALEIMSYLYAAGAPHASWRHWSRLAAFGYLLQRDYVEACPYVVLAGEWECLAAMRSLSPCASSPSAAALWHLAVRTSPSEVLPARDSVDRAWLELHAAVPSGDQARIEAALNALAEFWIAETDGDWEFFHPRSAPDFDPEPCAAAALARRHGYSPHALTPDVLRFLEPGLADGEPEPLYPQLSPFRPDTADRE